MRCNKTCRQFLQVSPRKYLQSDLLPSLGGHSVGPFSDATHFSDGGGHFPGGGGNFLGSGGHFSGGCGGLGGTSDLLHVPASLPENSLDSSEGYPPGGVGSNDQQRRLAIFMTFTDQGSGSGGAN